MAELTTKYFDSEGLEILLTRIASLFKYLKDYTDTAVENIDYTEYEYLKDYIDTAIENIDYTEYVTDATYDSEHAVINFSNQDGTVVSSIDASTFIMDGMLSSVSYDSRAATLTFIFNTDAGAEDITVDISSLIDTYTAGNGISVSDDVISAVISSSSESYLTVDENGLAVSGIDAIADRISAIEAWVDEDYLTSDDINEIITTLDATYAGFAEATGVTTSE